MNNFYKALVICLMAYFLPKLTNVATTDINFYLVNGAFSFGACYFLWKLRNNGFSNAILAVEIAALFLIALTVWGLKYDFSFFHDHYDTIMIYLFAAEASIFLSWLVMRLTPIANDTIECFHGLRIYTSKRFKGILRFMGLGSSVQQGNSLHINKIHTSFSEVEN